MENSIKILYIILGWLFGLLSPRIITSIKSYYERRNFFDAMKVELSELQVQVCLAGLQSAKYFGNLSLEYLEHVENILYQYKETHKVTSTLQLIDAFRSSSEPEKEQLIHYLRSNNDFGLSFKTYSTFFIDANAEKISKFPIDLQSKIYKLKNMLNIFNQDVLDVRNNHDRTFDGSITDINHNRLKNNIVLRYSGFQKASENMVNSIQQIIEYKL